MSSAEYEEPKTTAKNISSPPAKRKQGSELVHKVISYFPAIILFLLILAVWQIAVVVKQIPIAILPSPIDVIHTLVSDFGTLMSNLLTTMIEIVLGFVFGALVGMVFGILIAYSQTMERLLYPLVIASQMIPVFAIAPLLIIWFGFGMAPKIIIAAIIVFFPICVNQVEGLRSVDQGLVNLLRAFSATRWQIFRKASFPASVPYLIAGTQVGITFSVIGAVIAEWIGAQKGLGALMISANSMSRTDVVFAAIVVLAVLGLVLFIGVRLLADWLMPWQKKQSHH